jgi:hypothetical protein
MRLSHTILEQILFEVGNAINLTDTLGKEEVHQFLGTASMTEMMPNFDIVLALDCAYHFSTRTDFFREVSELKLNFFK